jgi:hypothetical protein
MRMWCARRWLGLLGFVVAVGGVLGGIAPAQQGLIPEELVVGMVPSRAATILQPPVEGLAKLVLDYVQKNGFSQVKRVRAVIPESYSCDRRGHRRGENSYRAVRAVPDRASD